MADSGTFTGEVQRAWARFWGLGWKIKGPVLGALALVVIGAISSASSSGGETSGEPVTKADEADSTPRAESTAKPTNTPKPTSTPPAPTATPLPSNMKQIGDLLLTVNGVALYSEPNQFMRAEAGTHYVAVDVTAMNTGSKTYSLNVFNFRLKDSDKYTSNHAATTKEPSIGAVDMVPGQEVRGFLVFKLGDGRTPVELQYQSFTGTPGTIPVSLP